jgi:hypothetical protein
MHLTFYIGLWVANFSQRWVSHGGKDMVSWEVKSCDSVLIYQITRRHIPVKRNRIYLSDGSTVLLVDLGHFFCFLLYTTVGRTPWTGDQLVVRRLPNSNTEWTQTNIYVSSGFEPTIPASERVKWVHALDRSATVTGHCIIRYRKGICACIYTHTQKFREAFLKMRFSRKLRQLMAVTNLGRFTY